jgi:hypothetical protein
MSPIDAESQIRFLVNVQRLLEEGKFTASYKFALLLALADLAVELGEDTDGELEIPTRRIAAKFIQYYWRQALPYPRAGETPTVLRQNTGQPAAIISRILETQHDVGPSVAHLRRDTMVWHRLLNDVDRTVRVMPLWRLQTIGGERADFLYENRGRGDRIRLRRGVAFCLRRFHGLIGDLVRGAWLRFVRRTNQSILGSTTDLSDFLFGKERSQLGSVRPILRDLQRGECFYCRGVIGGSSGHVDHFIPAFPWTWDTISSWSTVPATRPRATALHPSATWTAGFAGTSKRVVASVNSSVSMRSPAISRPLGA